MRRYSTARSGLLNAARSALTHASRSNPIDIMLLIVSCSAAPVTSELSGVPGRGRGRVGRGRRGGCCLGGGVRRGSRRRWSRRGGGGLGRRGRRRGLGRLGLLVHHHDEARLGDPRGGERRVVGEHLALVDQHHLGSRDLLRLGELGADVPDGRVVREVLLELLVGAAGWVSRDGEFGGQRGRRVGRVGSRDEQIPGRRADLVPTSASLFAEGVRMGEDLGGSARFTRASASREPASSSSSRFGRRADARARRAAPSRRRRARVAPDLSPDPAHRTGVDK